MTIDSKNKAFSRYVGQEVIKILKSLTEEAKEIGIDMDTGVYITLSEKSKRNFSGIYFGTIDIDDISEYIDQTKMHVNEGLVVKERM